MYRYIEVVSVVVGIFIINLKFCVNVRAVDITITAFPDLIDSQDQYSVDVRVFGATKATNYLGVSLFKEGTSNYFGETYNGSDWYGGSEGDNYFPIQIVDSSTSATLFFKIGSPSSTQYPGPGVYKLKIRRYTSSGNLSSSDIQTPASVNISYIFPSPTPTNSPTSVAYKAIYKINKPKSSGVEITGVQIFVDGGYIHHEDDEMIEFYNGHECYSGISCDLGIHTISLRKNGYISWEDTQNFSAGANLEVNPVLDKLGTASSTASPSILPTPTKTPIPTPTKTPVPTDAAASESAVLGIQENVSKTPGVMPVVPEKGKGKVPVLPAVLVIAGLCFIAIPIFSIIKNGQKSSETPKSLDSSDSMGSHDI